MAHQPKIVLARRGENAPPTDFQLTATETGGAFEWFEMAVPYAGGPDYHLHRRSDEVIRVLAGEVKLKLGEVLVDLRPGDTCYIPRGVAHTFTNIHPSRPARLLSLFAPAGLQALLRAWDNLVAREMPDEIVFAELAARFDQEILGPNLAVELNLPDVED